MADLQVHGPLLVLRGAPSELAAKIRENLDIRQQPKSFSRIAMVLNCGNWDSHSSFRLFLADPVAPIVLDEQA